MDFFLLPCDQKLDESLVIHTRQLKEDNVKTKNAERYELVRVEGSPVEVHAWADCLTEEKKTILCLIQLRDAGIQI